MKTTILSGLFLALCLFAAYAEAPKREGDVPVYPGAKLVSDNQSPSEAELASGGAPDFAFRLERTYSSTASVELIAQYYAPKLGAAFWQEGGADPNELEPGQVSSVGSGVELYDPDFIDKSPDAVRAAFGKRTRLPETDGWARVVTFTWAVKSPDKDPYSFSLVITDKSLPDDEPSRYNQASEITLAVTMVNQEKMEAFQAKMMEDMAAAQKAAGQVDAKDVLAQAQAVADAAQAAADRADAESKRIQAEFASVPGERDLGVAIYPGSRYSAEQSMFQSGFMTDMDRMYVFEVDAKPDALLRFYETRTGNKAATSTPGMAIIPTSFGEVHQKGDPPPIKNYVTIAGPTATGTSVLMFLVRPPGWTGQEGAGR